MADPGPEPRPKLTAAEQRVLIMLWDDPDRWLDGEYALVGADIGTARRLEKKELVVLKHEAWRRTGYHAGMGGAVPRKARTRCCGYVTPLGCQMAEALAPEPTRARPPTAGPR